MRGTAGWKRAHDRAKLLSHLLKIKHSEEKLDAIADQWWFYFGRSDNDERRAYDPNYKPDDNPTDVEDARIIPPRQVVDSMNPAPPVQQPTAVQPQETEDEQLW